MRAKTAATLLLIICVTIPVSFFGAIIYQVEDRLYQIHYVPNPVDNKLLDNGLSIFCFASSFSEWDKAHLTDYNGTYADVLTDSKITTYEIKSLDDFVVLVKLYNVTLVQRDAYTCQNNVVYFFYGNSNCFAYYLFDVSALKVI